MQKFPLIDKQFIPCSGSLRPGGEALAPLIEGPDAERLAAGDPDAEESGRREGFGNWVRGHLTRTPSMASAATGPGGSSASFRQSNLRLLLGVMGATLGPSRPSRPSRPNRCTFCPSRESLLHSRSPCPP